MNICIDARMIKEHTTGIGRILYETIIHLSQIDKANNYYIIHKEHPLDRLNNLSNFKKLYYKHSIYSPYNNIGIPNILLKYKIDIFHSFYFIIPFWTPCITIVSIHDLLYSHYPNYLSPIKKIVYDALTKLAITKSNGIITLSNYSKNDIIQFFKCSNEKIKVIPCAYNKNDFKVNLDKNKISSSKLKYNITSDYILYVGNHKPHKNLHRLIEAFSLVSKFIPHTLVIGGYKDKRYSDLYSLPNLFNINDRIHFAGQLEGDDLPLIYSGAALFVFPSLHEGFGIPPLEAMACGTPVLVSSFASLPEVTGEDAIIVNPLDVNDIANGIKRILTNKELSKQFSDKGIERAKLFSWSHVANETLQYYRDIVA